MHFFTLTFVGFFAVVTALYYLFPYRYRWIILVVGSYYFYAAWKPANLPFLLAPTLLAYVLAVAMEKSPTKKKKRIFLFLSLTGCLGLLIFFKYTGFLLNSLKPVFNLPASRVWSVILPIGISFYTFRLISYVMDVFRGKIPAERHLGYLALYVAFFPQILAGPIDRAANLLHQLKSKVRWDWEQIASGIQLIVWGLFKKMVIAEHMALFVNQVFRNPVQYHGINLLFGAYFYAFQIYCDFSGYSDIAIGLTRVLGFRSIDNFYYPYFSKNLTQFWNRWHISLSTWLRDYLFLPTSYALLRRIKKAKLLRIKTENWAYITGMMTTMVLGGLWHGANWTFIIWGALHGCYLAGHHMWKQGMRRLKKKSAKKRFPRIPNAIKIFSTFQLVSFAWIFFRAPSFNEAVTYIKNISLKLSYSGITHLVYTLSFVLVLIALEILIKNREKLGFLNKLPREVKVAAVMFFLCLIIIFAVDHGNEFIYFQF